MDINILAFLLLALISIFSSQNYIFRHFYLPIDSQIQKKYKEWKRQFAMQFSVSQDGFRLQVFALHIEKITSHNLQEERTYDLGLNQFAHLTEKQFSELILGKSHQDLHHLRHQQIPKDQNFFHINLTKLNDIDWQTLGKISEVKNQGSCNSGYAFSTTSLIETSLMMQNQYILLSQQQIIDCGVTYGTLGCEGGSRQGAIKYSQQKGLLLERQYPYTGSKESCKIQKGTHFPDFTVVISMGCDQIKENLYKSPQTVAVNAKNWQLYSNGVFNNCPSTGEVNHQALLVGVTGSYWRLKNSWGSRWGENGFIRVKLGNFCGICERPSFGFLL